MRNEDKQNIVNYLLSVREKFEVLSSKNLVYFFCFCNEITIKLNFLIRIIYDYIVKES